MGRNLDDIIKKLPSDRQKRIADLSSKKVEDMISQAATLTDFRKALGKTQAEVAKELGINQHAVSQLERRSDTYVSTLRRFLGSLGMTLELSVLDKNGVRIDLPNFLQWSMDPPVAAKPTTGEKNTAKAGAKKKTSVAQEPALRGKRSVVRSKSPHV